MGKIIRQVVLIVFVLVTVAGCTITDSRTYGGQETAVSFADLPTKGPLASTTPAGTQTNTPTPTATATIAPTATPIPPDLSLEVSDVNLYPIPNIYSGDLVTFQVLPYVPDTITPENVTVHIIVNDTTIASSVLSGRNLAGQATGILQWVWDTTGVVGTQQVTVILDNDDHLQIGDENPDNNTVSFPITILDQTDLPDQEQNATWIAAETSCCLVHAVTGTAAYRDLPDLLLTVEAAAQQASDALGATINRKYDIYFIDRVIGQGGYASSSIVISYLDRQYNGRGLRQVLTHEMVHLLDRQFAPQRIIFFAEGLAVWVTGGHYKPENVNERAVALLQMGEYLPLAQLINDFYLAQHETGYLEAASFIDYLVQRNGWQLFKAFYMDVTADDAPTLAEAVDVNLQIYYGQTLAAMEQEWLTYLNEQPVMETAVLDLQTTVRYYDVMRDYQLAYDPTAHFLTAWLPYPDDVQELGNPADLTRHPQTELNITLETMLLSVDTALRDGDYERANVLLDSVERVLEQNGRFVDPLAVSYHDIVLKMIKTGFTPQQITLNGETAVVLVTSTRNNNLIKLNLLLRGQEWIILSS
ncbi:MAG: hypothetical protein H6660_14290 [Ardenticatenaceae bacterium]|nr:hypothetical protein [Ardenticatenaceae bacterium]